MMRLAKLMTVLAAGLLLAATGSAGAAETQWQKDHPRRSQVNRRLRRQNARINQGVRNGTLTHQQARQLHKEDHQIRQEERDMASQNGGHITKQEQRTLNQQENATSRQIHSEKHPQ
jgi:hypothetical protein